MVSDAECAEQRWTWALTPSEKSLESELLSTALMQPHTLQENSVMQPGLAPLPVLSDIGDGAAVGGLINQARIGGNQNTNDFSAGDAQVMGMSPAEAEYRGSGGTTYWDSDMPQIPGSLTNNQTPALVDSAELITATEQLFLLTMPFLLILLITTVA